MSNDPRSRAATLGKLALAVVVAGAVVAGLAFPAIGGTGLAARNSASLFHALPVELTDKTPAGNTKVLAADGSLITQFYSNNRTPVTSEQIAPVMKQAQVDIEDSRFYEHNGLDVQGTLRALVTNVAAGGVREGGSTLTQQLVKQTLLQTAGTPAERAAATAQTPGRKLREARLALALEQTYSKDEILTRYLNIVYFGEGAYGVQAAARTYFSVDAKDLTLPQAAMLAGLVQSPTNDDPISNPDNAVKRRDQVLQRMHDLGHISDADLQADLGKPVAVAPSPPPGNGCTNATVGGFFCAYVRGYLLDTLKIPQSTLDDGGLTVQTTLQPDLQRSSDQGVLNYAPLGDRFAGILTAVEPGTGHVLAMSDNRRYGCTGDDCESVVLNTVAGAGSGSTYKVFTAAAALAQGFGSGYTINAPQPYTSKVFKKNGGTRGAPYVVGNDNANYLPTYDMQGALTASANTYFVALEDALGSVDGPVDTARAMGMHFDHPQQLAVCANVKCTDLGDFYKQAKLGSFTLGPDATSPLDLATAYATIAAQGTQCDPTPVTQVLDRNGKPLTDDSGKVVDTGNHCKADAIPAGVANTLANMMLDVVSDGTGRKAAIPGQSIAGKTGTIQGDNSATFVGITPKYAVSVMYYNPKGVENVGGHGGGVPAQIFHDAMAPVIGNQPNVPFPAPDPAVQAGTRGSGFVPPPAAGQSPPAGQDNGGATTNGTDNGGGNGGGNGGDGIRDGGTGFGGTGFGGNPNGRRGGGGRGNDGGGGGGNG